MRSNNIGYGDYNRASSALALFIWHRAERSAQLKSSSLSQCPAISKECTVIDFIQLDLRTLQSYIADLLILGK